MKKFMCKGKWSRYIAAAILGSAVGYSLYRATGVPIPGLTLAVIGTFVYRGSKCNLRKRK